MNLVSEFCKSHSLDPSGDYSNIVIPLRAATECHDLASHILSKAINESPRENVISIAYENIIARIHEHSEAMLVCIATNSFSSGEVLARVVVESSINLSYQTKNGLEAPLIAYFKRWLSSHAQTLNEWKEYEKNIGDPDKTAKIVEERVQWLEELRAFLDSLIEELGLDEGNSPNAWPRKIFKRFEGVEKKGAYYTSYHRLSSASHVLAEDTLLYLQAYSQSDVKVLQELGVMAIHYSVMMTYIAMIFMVNAFESITRVYQPSLELLLFQTHRTRLENEISSISAKAGCIE